MQDVAGYLEYPSPQTSLYYCTSQFKNFHEYFFYIETKIILLSDYFHLNFGDIRSWKEYQICSFLNSVKYRTRILYLVCLFNGLVPLIGIHLPRIRFFRFFSQSFIEFILPIYRLRANGYIE